ncbi:MAG: tyrosine-type recombinase/integrase [Clostridia bacterium]|nr:tyrosine-type recombinase/integrase [Clostridia bacterium]
MNRPDVLPIGKAFKMVAYLRGLNRLRDAAMVACTAGFGLRISDVLALTWEDLLDGDRVREIVTIREQKTRKQRSLMVLPVVAEAISAWYAACRPVDPHARVFPITREHAYRIVRDTAKALGFHGRITPHSLRKAFCDHVYNLTRDPVMTARITGHSNPAQLLRYIGRLPETEMTVWRRFAESLERSKI